MFLNKNKEMSKRLCVCMHQCKEKVWMSSIAIIFMQEGRRKELEWKEARKENVTSFDLILVFPTELSENCIRMDSHISCIIL